ncbi:glycosyltransferase [Candidatus Pseudothioglobus singularis]|nr:glycosyltransferase [Candidatus Pseudothioglobus singularis]
MNDEQKPLVSIIMNCYNSDRFLNQAIDSIYEQSYQNWEIIFWDNASTDKSAGIALSYTEKLKYYVSKNTTSLGEARVLAVSQSKGEYLAFLDCDDLWSPQKLEKQMKVILKNKKNVGLIYSLCDVVSENGTKIGQIPSKSELYSGMSVFDELVKKNFIPFVSVLVSRSKYLEVGGFPINYKNSTDYDLFLKLSYNYEVLVIDEVLCKYREHSKNLSHRQYVIAAEESINSVSSFLPDDRAVEGLRYQNIELAIASIKEKNFFMAISLLLRHGGLGKVFSRIFNKIRSH